MKRRFIIILITMFVFSVLLDFLFRTWEGHGGLLGFHMPGLFALFGFIACVLLILVSKFIGHYWLQRKEDYYEGKDDDK